MEYHIALRTIIKNAAGLGGKGDKLTQLYIGAHLHDVPQYKDIIEHNKQEVVLVRNYVENTKCCRRTLYFIGEQNQITKICVVMYVAINNNLSLSQLTVNH